MLKDLFLGQVAFFQRVNIFVNVIAVCFECIDNVAERFALATEHLL